MAQDRPTDALYDFLYRDSSRIVSYYAQLFEGRLVSIEETDSDRDTIGKEGKVNVGIAGGELRSVQETQISAKRTFDPHDLITTDVLSRIVKRIQPSLKESPNASLIRAKGTLVFVDRHMLEFANTALDFLIDEEKRKPIGKKEKTSTINSLQIVKSFMGKIPLPSTFLLQTADGVQVVGTIKDDGMEEPISTYYFKHGISGLSDVHVIGVKEIASNPISLPIDQLIGAGQQAAEVLHNMLFPKEAIKVTPIALYREL